ncbi:MAG: hypothetical protein AAF289_12835 [Cyanobacteria bacterium P01_A01_bin.135]
MSQFEIDALLQAAFERCQQLGHALTEAQQQTLCEVLLRRADADTNGDDPLDELTAVELQQFLAYVQSTRQRGLSWKTRLLNDWLGGQDSGPVQFIRDRYGVGWLDRVQPWHLAPHLDRSDSPLRVGDRIEVSNGLWEWVQEQGPCRREWVTCQVVSLSEAAAGGSAVVRFTNGMEYEIQGIYDWNRYQWRRQRATE